MKNLLFALAFVCCTGVYSQVPSNIVTGSWQNAMMRADGRTVIDGVEAYCMRSMCNGEEHLYLKFKNTNNYQVAVEWVDAIYMNGGWNYPQNTTPKKVYVPANSEVEGTCNGNIKLKFQINSIIAVPNGSGHYDASGIKVSQ